MVKVNRPRPLIGETPRRRARVRLGRVLPAELESCRLARRLASYQAYLFAPRPVLTSRAWGPLFASRAGAEARTLRFRRRLSSGRALPPLHFRARRRMAFRQSYRHAAQHLDRRACGDGAPFPTNCYSRTADEPSRSAAQEEQPYPSPSRSSADTIGYDLCARGSCAAFPVSPHAEPTQSFNVYDSSARRTRRAGTRAG